MPATGSLARSKLGLAHRKPAKAGLRYFCMSAPAGRTPSPTGKVDRAQPGTDEGKKLKSWAGPVEWQNLSPRVGDDAHIVPKVRQQSSGFVPTGSTVRLLGSLGERVFPHPSRLTACHLPRRGRRPPAGEGDLPAGEGDLRREEEWPPEVVNFFLLSLKKADSVL